VKLKLVVKKIITLFQKKHKIGGKGIMPINSNLLLRSNILATGSKFIVDKTTTDSSFGPGSIGFISHVKGIDVDFKNVFFVSCSLIRKGKSGKTRMDRCEMSMPIFDLSMIKLNEDIIEPFRQIMPEEKRKYYVHILPMENTRDVLKMTNEDFLGWLFSYAMFMKRLSTKAKHIKPWPKENTILSRAQEIDSYWSNHQASCIELFCPEMKRIEAVAELRKIENAFRRSSLSYLKKISEIEQGSIKYVAHELDRLGKLDNKLKEALVNVAQSAENKALTFSKLLDVNRGE